MNRTMMICEAGEAIDALTGPAARELVDLRREIEHMEAKRRQLQRATEQARKRLEFVARRIIHREIRKRSKMASIGVTVECSELYDHSSPELRRRPHVHAHVLAAGTRFEMEFCPVAVACLDAAAKKLAAAVAAVVEADRVASKPVDGQTKEVGQ